MTAGFPPGLLLITDRAQARLPLVEIADAALAAGFAAVMLREKDLGGRELFELAATLHEICARYGRPLLVNDRLDVALALPGLRRRAPGLAPACPSQTRDGSWGRIDCSATPLTKRRKRARRSRPAPTTSP